MNTELEKDLFSFFDTFCKNDSSYQKARQSGKSFGEVYTSFVIGNQKDLIDKAADELGYVVSEKDYQSIINLHHTISDEEGYHLEDSEELWKEAVTSYFEEGEAEE